MNSALYLNDVMSPMSGTRHGFSSSAEFVDAEISELDDKLQDSYQLGMAGKGAINELDRIFIEYSDPQCEGCDALPVTRESFELSKRFLKRLPFELEPPLIGAEPDGQITMEWYRNPRWTLSISFDPEGKLHYAALFGPNKVYGSESFFNEVPRNILELIQRVIS
jgi:hypothetical protein